MFDLNALPNQKAGEQTVTLLRRHWIVLAKTIALLITSALIPVAVYLLLLSEFPAVLGDQTLAPLIALFGSFYYLAVWLFVFQEIVDYYLDTWILTTERVLDIEQFGLFRRETTECHLASVVDVTSETKGMLETFLKFGDVIIKTAGEKGLLVFKQVPNPEEVRRLVLKLVDDDREKHGRGV